MSETKLQTGLPQASSYAQEVLTQYRSALKTGQLIAADLAEGRRIHPRLEAQFKGELFVLRTVLLPKVRQSAKTYAKLDAFNVLAATPPCLDDAFLVLGELTQLLEDSKMFDFEPPVIR